ncbi:hypothetical protein [Kitasatospora sp. A2-31]|uniref:hypothetical protein n=1 Tax=Kitasatospora sp. A2-31 TaxID=2916414 RepID=UPI001EEBB7C1|nr:hypothetical protein [Kitasatospora sp. A2-31]MCG6497623.1 hypothetical protein [Kitasatospora sp. A2-31]
MNAVAERAVAHATARLQNGWPLLLVAFALFGPADTLARLVLLAAGAVFTIARPTAGPAAAKTRKPPTAPKPATVPAPRKSGDPQ